MSKFDHPTAAASARPSSTFADLTFEDFCTILTSRTSPSAPKRKILFNDSFISRLDGSSAHLGSKLTAAGFTVDKRTLLCEIDATTFLQKSGKRFRTEILAALERRETPLEAEKIIQLNAGFFLLGMALTDDERKNAFQSDFLEALKNKKLQSTLGEYVAWRAVNPDENIFKEGEGMDHEFIRFGTHNPFKICYDKATGEFGVGVVGMETVVKHGPGLKEVLEDGEQCCDDNENALVGKLVYMALPLTQELKFADQENVYFSGCGTSGLYFPIAAIRRIYENYLGIDISNTAEVATAATSGAGTAATAAKASGEPSTSPKPAQRDNYVGRDLDSATQPVGTGAKVKGNSWCC